MLRKPPLNYPPVAKRLKKEALVTVRVLVDENGRAAEAEQAFRAILGAEPRHAGSLHMLGVAALLNPACLAEALAKDG